MSPPQSIAKLKRENKKMKFVIALVLAAVCCHAQQPSNANGWEYTRLPQVMDASEAHAASHPLTGATFSWFHDRTSKDFFIWLHASPGPSPAFSVGSQKFGDVVAEWVRAAGDINQRKGRDNNVVVITKPGDHRADLLAYGFILEEAVPARGEHEWQQPAHDRYRKAGSRRKSATDL